MKFNIEKLGCLNKADIELGDLTIICGDNNAGKTYVSYAIYGFLKFWINKSVFKISKEEIEKLLQNGIVTFDLRAFEKEIPSVLDSLSKKYMKFIPRIFSADENHFSETSFHFSSSKLKPTYHLGFNAQFFFGTKENLILKAVKDKDNSVLEISLLMQDETLIPHVDKVKDFINYSIGGSLLGEYFPKPFIITSERSGISLFHKELDISKNVLVETLQEHSKRKNKIDISDFFKMIDNTVSRYARPIKDNIDFVRDVVDIYSKKKSMLIEKHPELKKELNKIIGGDYKIEDNQIMFSFKDKRITKKIPVHFASSSVKSLLDLNFYIKHIATEGDILMIDEPELNLHPANQRRIVRLFVRLIKAGVKVFITTHSDYLIKELNNLIILGSDFEDKKEIMKQYCYTKDDIADKTKIKVYIAEDNTLKMASIDDLGIEIGSFDHEIDEMNQMFDKMTVNIESAYSGN
jgi:predicted ATPase